ncbi:hypothetical protein [Paractinoplanes abujensis]|uniref:Uncharacterized protein n=1 Tax=Paractinoplanes abujensis TaxID=882441 RepID=A0A7W7G058_9ACTN|nr:hypothetical protein [Actinoplanes abujensis]MBB4691254.1 hypothetical protein [Actinoplanes abujensis]
MTEPGQDDLIRALVAFMPFVQRWHLPLNPEDMDEIVYALLLHSRSALSWDEITAAVHHQIDEHEEQARRMSEAMGRAAATEAHDNEQGA